jgi:hypothetical protein
MNKSKNSKLFMVLLRWTDQKVFQKMFSHVLAP